MRDDLTAVYEAQSLLEAQLLADRLEAADIKSFIDHANSPLDGLVAGEQLLLVRVLPADAETARLIVADFEAEKAEE